MKFLLDTNILSESIRSSPNAQVMEFLRSYDPANLFVSVLTLGEIRKGIEKLQHINIRKQQLEFWLETNLVHYFAGRILPISREVANKWGKIVAQTKQQPAIDSLIAATAICHNMVLVSRNTKDFTMFPVEVHNPWIEVIEPVFS